MTVSLPVIDIASLRAGSPGAVDPRAVEAVAAEIRAACTGPGFFYIRGHGIPQPVIDAAVTAARDLFHLPTETKRLVAANALHRGWHAMGGALMEGAKLADRKEFFSIGLELPADDETVLAGEKLRGPNQWPAFAPAVQPAFSAYYREVGACGAALLSAVAVSLGIDPAFFAARYRKPLQRTQAIYYPPQQADADAEEFGVAAHTDFGCITLLWQDDKGGLQVRERQSGQWIEAPPLPGTMVVNVGDLLGRWSNDRFASTPHRVLNRSGQERFSIATFYDPDFSAVVDPRALGVPDAEARYEPITAGQHILNRFDRAFGYRKALAAAQ
ncbi:isopenicillin N synthase family oxygenase [Roseomonas sp. OT10]|uniref:isopenicillin N synthase family dioxygenase n=1 Tax=Roseomonas cutis TaxID=2897332 RepID=UPI001E5E42A5|nr:2-oxoglutarate and iron-dependent oxygenase domain-containing protein [Roseomonas sp. OT10]UFN51072.1 isopenicillin N synthase family oxygenase [Roseomonas sp. OT10]